MKRLNVLSKQQGDLVLEGKEVLSSTILWPASIGIGRFLLCGRTVMH